MDRKQANHLILYYLNTLVEKYPYMKFQELLQYSNVIKQIPIVNSEGQNELVIQDEMFVESSDIVNRMRLD